ncbi:protein of unknown function [Burkholderia multivorans]
MEHANRSLCAGAAPRRATLTLALERQRQRQPETTEDHPTFTAARQGDYPRAVPGFQDAPGSRMQLIPGESACRLKRSAHLRIPPAAERRTATGGPIS